MKPATAFRAGAGKNESVYQPRTMESDLLSNKAAHGEPEQIDLRQTKHINKVENVGGKPRGRLRSGTGRESNAAVVDKDHLPFAGDGIDERWIPVVEIPSEVLEEHNRN